MSDQPFEIDDEQTIKIYGVRWSMGIFKALGLGPIGSVFQIVKREDGTITLRQLFGVSPPSEGKHP